MVSADRKIRRVFAEVLAQTGGDRKAAKEAVSSDKKGLRGVLWSGRFNSRERPANETLIAHSGLLCADLHELGERIARRAPFCDHAIIETVGAKNHFRDALPSISARGDDESQTKNRVDRFCTRAQCFYFRRRLQLRVPF